MRKIVRKSVWLMSSPSGAEEILHSPFSYRRENSKVDLVPGLVEL